ncbi:MAG: Na+/H+ antiporter NhaC family protein [Bacteroidales bacterium]|nr:Na+/H+ antiporter NhaC family protein [Bacteroidales bacterium]
MAHQVTFRRANGVTRKGWLAVSPLLFFVLLFTGLSVWVGDFYKVPILAVFTFTAAYAIITTRGLPLAKRIALYSSGADANLMQMVWIFVLAGAFASTAKALGAVDAAVNLTLSYLPPEMLLAGFFVAACFISLSIGTSVGTIVALAPMVPGVAEHAGFELPMLTAAIVGGAFFGDNLSFISDTTIAAARTQHCKLSDKFRVNVRIVLPAALVVVAVYVYLGLGVTGVAKALPVDGIKMLPYMLVLVLAFIGVDVLLSLGAALLLTCVLWLGMGHGSLEALLVAMGDGIMGMSETILIALMASGLFVIIRFNGGITFIIKQMKVWMHSKRSGELGVGMLVALANVCTANNTVAILSVGSIARDVSLRYGIDPRKTASVLDTSSCVVQSFLPYGAQLLLAASYTGLSPVALMPYLYYPMGVAVMTVLAIMLRYPHRYS